MKSILLMGCLIVTQPLVGMQTKPVSNWPWYASIAAFGLAASFTAKSYFDYQSHQRKLEQMPPVDTEKENDELARLKLNHRDKKSDADGVGLLMYGVKFLIGDHLQYVKKYKNTEYKQTQIFTMGDSMHRVKVQDKLIDFRRKSVIYVPHLKDSFEELYDHYSTRYHTQEPQTNTMDSYHADCYRRSFCKENNSWQLVECPEFIQKLTFIEIALERKLKASTSQETLAQDALKQKEKEIQDRAQLIQATSNSWWKAIAGVAASLISVPIMYHSYVARAK